MYGSVCQESGGSARTDYRAIQLAKKKKQRGPSASSGKTHTHTHSDLMLFIQTRQRLEIKLWSDVEFPQSREFRTGPEEK